VLLVEQDHEPGGSLLASSAQIDDIDSDAWIGQTKSALEAATNVTVMTSSTVSGYYDHNVLTITDRSTVGIKRFWKVRAKQVVLATGAIEQPLVFENNDRPGIMLAHAAMEYVNRYAIKPADVMALATNNDSAYGVAFALHHSGVRVAAIVDARINIEKDLVAKAVRLGIPVMPGSVVVDTLGSKALTAIKVGSLSDAGSSTLNATHLITCQGLAISGGFNPANDL
jgi:sarcosine oxidase subunit alpha